VGRVEDYCLMLVLKAVDPSEDEHLVVALKTIFS